MSAHAAVAGASPVHDRNYRRRIPLHKRQKLEPYRSTQRTRAYAL